MIAALAMLAALTLGPPAHHHRAAVATPAAAKPAIHKWLIPFPRHRKLEMAAYSKRHYGHAKWRLRNPKVIVEHYAVASTASVVRNTFLSDAPDIELHERPGTCSHFVVDSHGAIYSLVPTTIRCRHTVGLNWTAIGIEHTGFSDADVLDRPKELRASLKLTQWLRCRYHISIKNVIGHNESLSSPYHQELVPAFKHQTHGDMRHASMVRYRRALGKLGPC